MRRPLATAAGRRLGRALGWAAVAWVISLGLARLHDYRGWDQSFYLAQTSSLVEDGDVDLRNDLLHLHREPTRLLSLLTKLRGNGHLANAFAIGTSVLWLPVYALTKVVSSLFDGPEVRWAPLQLVGLQLFSLAAVTWLLWAIDRWLRRMGLPGRLAVLATLALVVGTPVAFYGLRAYTYSHLASIVAVLWLVVAALQLGDRPTVFWALLCGVALGVAFLCRWQNLVKGLVLLAPLAELWRLRVSPRRLAGLAAAAAGGALVVGGLQLHAWLLDRGEFLTLPQGGGFFDPAQPAIGPFLLSGFSGLLPWSPVFALGLLGLLLPWRLRLPPVWRWIALGVLLGDIFLNASVADWWAGATYGPRRMVADVPLLAVGVANLALGRRLRPWVAAALVLCCAWGAVTANLRLHGLSDLSILVRGRPSAAARVGESVAQPTPALARDLALSWPLGRGRMSYFAGTWRHGRLLTVAVGAVACALVGWGLARPRAPARLAPVLLLALALVLYAHARLLVSGRFDPEERRLWVQLAQSARGREPSLPGPVGELPPGAPSLEYRYADARRYLHAFALAHQLRRPEARGLAAELARRPYPFGPHLVQQLALAPGERQLLHRPGFFWAARPERPARVYTLVQKLELGCGALYLDLSLEPRTHPPGAGARLLSFGRGGEAPLLLVEAAEDRVRLITAEAHVETALRWRPSEPHELALEWHGEVGRVVLTARAGDSGPATLLEAPLAPPAGELGRFELVVGSLRSAGSVGAASWRVRYSDLSLRVRDICRDGESR